MSSFFKLIGRGGGFALMADATKKGPDPPTDADTAEARRKRMEELRSRKGRGASIVTGGAGITEPATLGKTSLLGSA